MDSIHSIPTLFEEESCKKLILEALSRYRDKKLDKELHVKYLRDSLTRPLPEGYVSLDASRPWLFFWSLRSLYLLNAFPEHGSELHGQCIRELLELQHPNGGFCGNIGHTPHLAATYAACASLSMLKATKHIDTAKMSEFLCRLKIRDTGAVMIQEQGGEDDLRALYCAAAVARICGILDKAGLFDSTFVKRIKDCQTHEGGLGAVPFAEAHGGYTYCGLAALSIIGQIDAVDVSQSLSFGKRMQCEVTGGLRGRTNKLVDGCYSFWQAASCLIASKALGKDPVSVLDWNALQSFILEACQDPKGGLRDKPGKPADLYHTCYCLSGLRLCELLLEGSNVPDDFLALNI